MTQLPTGWEKVPIETLYIGLYDGPHATPPEAEEGPVFLGIKNLTDDGHLDLNDVRHISWDDYPEWTRRVEPQPDDIVFTYEATLHRYAIIPEGFKGCLGRRVALIRPDDTKVDTKFLFYSFFGHQWRTEVSKYLLVGSTVDRIPLSDFPNFKLFLPPLPTQRRIAAILSAYDDLIEVNQRRIDALEAAAQALYREWFVEFRFPGHESAEWVTSELGEIPRGWEVYLADEVIDYHIGGSWGKEEPAGDFNKWVYVVRGTDIPGARHLQTDDCPKRVLKQSYYNSRELQPGDLIIEVSGGSKDQPVGRALLVSERLLHAFDEDLICASFCKLVRPKTEILWPELLYLHIEEIYENGKIEKYQVQSTGIKNFKWQYFLESELVLVPPRQLQNRFVDIIRSLYEQVRLLGQRNVKLRETRDLLLPRLISGEVSVEGLPLPEEVEA